MSRGIRVKSSAASSALLAEARALSGDFDKLSQAVAEAVGLSPTELLAMDLISRSGPVTAGYLARELHLTTGAITGLVDRLERAGYARRIADADDRRRVLVGPTARERRVGELYRPLSENLRRVVEGYSERDLATLTDFLAKLRVEISGVTETLRRRGRSATRI